MLNGSMIRCAMRFCERCNQREGVFQTLLMLVCHQCVRCDDEFCDNCNGRLCMSCVLREQHAMCLEDCPACCYNEELDYPLREYTRQEIVELLSQWFDNTGLYAGPVDAENLLRLLERYGLMVASFNGTFFGDKVVRDGDHAGDG